MPNIVDLPFTPCGQDCNECHYYKKECYGCMQTGGIPFWANEIGLSICPIFNCAVNDKQLLHCGNCTEYPCKTYLNLRDPSINDKEWEKSLSERKENLLKMKGKY